MQADAVDRLRRGDDGAAVLAMLREKCDTPKALSCVITRIRKTMMAELPSPECGSLAPFANEPGVAAFLASSLADKVRVQREHRYDPTWSDGAERALATLQLLPSNLAALRLSQPEVVSLKRKHEATLLHKQESLIHIPCAGEWLRHVIELAKSSHVMHSYARLALPLLLLSGRRTTEILNGQSTFLPTPRATTCMFTGQIKKRGASTTYEIPLLCDYEVFAHALGVLREKQGGVCLTPEACNARYAKNLSAAMPTLFPSIPHVHALRACYAAFAFHLYTCETTFNRAAMRMLGHEALEVSLSYNAVVLHDCNVAADAYGALP